MRTALLALTIVFFLPFFRLLPIILCLPGLPGVSGPPVLRAQSGADPVAASAAGAWLRPRSDPWGALTGSPLLGGVRDATFGVAYFPPAWGLPELASSAAVGVVPIGSGSAGMSLTHFGSSLYSETEGGLAWGAAAGGTILYGASVRVRRLEIERHGGAWTPRVDLAAAVPAGGWSIWGIRVSDVNRGAVGRSGERLRQRLSLAAAFFATGWPSLLLQAGDEEAGIGVRAALEAAVEPLVFRAGASGEMTRIHAGFECRVGRFTTGYSVVVHPVLGWSHAFWLSGGVSP